ncbi:AAA family ATPase [Xanthomonas citri]|uniref:AAA family ATPase n=1 Tax=Xanthomonas citri TaxID=346 RepID=UPI0018FF688A|nr:AAA family ATPase [Xanthomonas citri]QQK68117.1 AAA family ATPase [Xanthomonas citri]
MDEGVSRNAAADLSSRTHRIQLRFDEDIFDNFIDVDDAWNSEELSHLVAMGLLRVDSLRVKVESAPSEDFLTGKNGASAEDLSSGQWQLLNSLINLALKASSNSIILIDEPENSLHPEWQRDYVKVLGAALGEAKGCHTIIATHSPLIAAGVDSQSGNILAAKRAEIGGMIEIDEAGSVYAWRPDDVLREKFDMDTARAPELEDLANRLLAILGGASDEPSEPNERENIARRLQLLAGNLPPDDPLVPALRVLARLGLDGKTQVSE